MANGPIAAREDDGLAVGRELRHEAFGVIGGEFDRLALRQRGDQEPIPLRRARKHDPVIRGAELCHVDVAEVRSDEPR